MISGSLYELNWLAALSCEFLTKEYLSYGPDG